jgi:hypothetical protein
MQSASAPAPSPQQSQSMPSSYQVPFPDEPTTLRVIVRSSVYLFDLTCYDQNRTMRHGRLLRSDSLLAMCFPASDVPSAPGRYLPERRDGRLLRQVEPVAAGVTLAATFQAMSGTVEVDP